MNTGGRAEKQKMAEPVLQAPGPDREAVPSRSLQGRLTDGDCTAASATSREDLGHGGRLEASSMSRNQEAATPLVKFSAEQHSIAAGQT